MKDNRPGTDHDIITNGDIVDHAGTDRDPTPFTKTHGSAQMSADRDMGEITQSAIMIYRSTGIDNAAVAKPGIGVNHRTCHHYGSFANYHILRHDSVGVNQNGKMPVLEAAHQFLTNGGIADGDK